MRKLKSVILEVGNDETITIDELSIAEYRETLFGLIRQYGNATTLTMLSAKIITVEIADILNRQNFHYISSWTIKNGNDDIIPMTYENYIQLPYCIESKIIDVVHGFSEL